MELVYNQSRAKIIADTRYYPCEKHHMIFMDLTWLQNIHLIDQIQTRLKWTILKAIYNQKKNDELRMIINQLC